MHSAGPVGRGTHQSWGLSVAGSVNRGGQNGQPLDMAKPPQRNESPLWTTHMVSFLSWDHLWQFLLLKKTSSDPAQSEIGELAGWITLVSGLGTAPQSRSLKNLKQLNAVWHRRSEMDHLRGPRTVVHGPTFAKWGREARWHTRPRSIAAGQPTGIRKWGKLRAHSRPRHTRESPYAWADMQFNMLDWKHC